MASDADLVDLHSSPDFDSSRCLFCNQMSASIDDNLDHMQKAHGLFIPNREHLVVDVETLLAYFDLIISGYMECLYCGSERNTVDAVQQHMRGKAHCRFDLEGEDSEFRDLYDFSSYEQDNIADGSVDGDVDDTNRALTLHARASPSWRPVDDSLRLPSGKLVMQRTARPLWPRQQRLRQAGDNAAEPSQQPDGGSCVSTPDPVQGDDSPTAMTRSERRVRDFTTHQLVHLRAADRQSLVHLSISEQRAVLATQKKQLDRSRRTSRAMQSRVETLGNKNLMMHFVSDVPGRKNG
ncbi:c2h2 finger domain containing protein [Grosmannia clavigera kw1407]|uniref:C2h2 finger domain containing protein n=1 Tax=Grosmannia clavigera (strain kw1407 / UAMH 11150) TaxID=655863 RepID=F0XND8_GROCL|nr:c2h2 finger domain containing protein [Grosmannia clavigera kw1407]EFX00787.1 c2h2 finger domain containing protein [Grosmannia clavigera kw1407]